MNEWIFRMNVPTLHFTLAVSSNGSNTQPQSRHFLFHKVQKRWMYRPSFHPRLYLWPSTRGGSPAPSSPRDTLAHQQHVPQSRVFSFHKSFDSENPYHGTDQPCGLRDKEKDRPHCPSILCPSLPKRDGTSAGLVSEILYILLSMLRRWQQPNVSLVIQGLKWYSGKER